MVTAEEAVAVVQSGETVFVHSAAGTPQRLVDALARHGQQNRLRDVTVCHIHTEGRLDHLQPHYAG